jgi:hypothetical protein
LIIRDLEFVLLPGNPPRLRVGSFNVNTSEVSSADMFAAAKWFEAIGERLAEAAAKLTDSKPEKEI